MESEQFTIENRDIIYNEERVIHDIVYRVQCFQQSLNLIGDMFGSDKDVESIKETLKNTRTIIFVRSAFFSHSKVKISYDEINQRIDIMIIPVVYVN